MPSTSLRGDKCKKSAPRFESDPSLSSPERIDGAGRRAVDRRGHVGLYATPDAVDEHHEAIAVAWPGGIRSSNTDGRGRTSRREKHLSAIWIVAEDQP